MEDKLNLIKGIFESPTFRDQTQERQREIVDEILATGEVSAEEVEYLYARSISPWLENLPYDLFIRFMLSSGIKGKDIINLCNSSPVLNDYCNRGLTLQDGTMVDQYLFRLLLQRDRPGIPYEKFLVKDEEDKKQNKETPRDTYKYVVIDRVDDHNKLYDLLGYISETSWDLTYNGNANNGIDKPQTLEYLLYNDNKEQFGLLSELAIQEGALEYNEDDLYLLQHLHYLVDAIVDEITLLAHNSKEDLPWSGFHLHSIWQVTRNPSLVIEYIIKNNIDLELILNTIRQNGRTMNVSSTRLEPIIKILPDNQKVTEIMKNFNMIYRSIINASLPKDYETLKLLIVRRLREIITEYLDHIDDIPEDSDDEDTIFVWSNLIEILGDLNNGSLDYVLDYVIESHNKILTNQLDVTDRIKNK